MDKPELAARFNGQVVFIGVTSISATYDRVATPYGQGRIPGVEVHAQLFETLERGRFLTDASNLAVLAFLRGRRRDRGLDLRASFGMDGLRGRRLDADRRARHAVSAVPRRASCSRFSRRWLRPGSRRSPPQAISISWCGGALQASETERHRYQQAIHFVTHEMRTPLTAIQGSSELMGRYNLSEEKRKQIAEMINMESKRLARMIQTFLDVERLSDGQMELKREPFPVSEIVGGLRGARAAAGRTQEHPHPDAGAARARSKATAS